MDQVLTQLKAYGFTVKATSSHGQGLVEGYLPLRNLQNIANVPGVRSITPAFRPLASVGLATTQAVAVQQVGPVQQMGWLGTGIKLGVISDSFNTLGGAAKDVSSGDLPGVGNPNGHTTAVTVASDYQSVGTDEGRAMLQLVHDIAPAANLYFASGLNGEVDFANQILALREKYGADIIVDDLTYYDEPFFSDGLLAQSVNQVVSEGAAYFSAAGNLGNGAYEAVYNPVLLKDALKQVVVGKANVDLEAALRSSALNQRQLLSFHNFATTGIDITQTFVVQASALAAGGITISFQWDEPFGLGKVTTDYDLLVFSKNGKYIGKLTGNDDNLATDQALELTRLPVGQYQLMIARTNNGPATHLKYIAFPGGGFTAEHFPGGPTVMGHTAAKGARAIAAIDYRTPTVPEPYTSVGPATIYFDSAGNPLAQPDIRQTPQIAAVDGVDTTFFGTTDTDLNSFPNFFGTSAAVPHAAAIAALILEAAGGPGSLTPTQLYNRLQTQSIDIPVDANLDQATAVLTPVNGTSPNTTALVASGTNPASPGYFRINYTGTDTSDSLTQLVLDLGAIGLVFNPKNQPFTLGVLSPGLLPAYITATVTNNTQLTLDFAPGTFKAGEYCTFGIDWTRTRSQASAKLASFRNATTNTTVGAGTSADQLSGAVISAKAAFGLASNGTFENYSIHSGRNLYTGSGLVDALLSIQGLP
jgi:hypothetical protein